MVRESVLHRRARFLIATARAAPGNAFHRLDWQRAVICGSAVGEQAVRAPHDPRFARMVEHGAQYGLRHRADRRASIAALFSISSRIESGPGPGVLGSRCGVCIHWRQHHGQVIVALRA